MARANLASFYLRQGDRAKAEDTLRQATEDLSDTSTGAQLLLSYYMGTNQVDKAASAYADLVNRTPRSVPLKMAYARVLLAKHDVAKAREIGAELAKTNGSDPDVAVLNSMLLLNDGKAGRSLRPAAESRQE